jgi:DNA-binding transcriptional ArsR family regulator
MGGSRNSIRGLKLKRESTTIVLLRPRYSAALVLDAFERLLWWLFGGSAGAKTRAHVLDAVREEPRNAQQLSEALGLDYTTVRHHLKVMEQNRIVVTEGNSYGKLYFLSDSMEAHWPQFEAIVEKTGKRSAR